MQWLINGAYKYNSQMCLKSDKHGKMALKLKARHGYYTTSIHGKHHSTMGPQNRAKAAQIMNKISLEHGQNMLESRAKTTCNVS